jgi:hypothetical protein
MNQQIVNPNEQISQRQRRTKDGIHTTWKAKTEFKLH